VKQRLETHGYLPDIGPDGWPLDRRHPVYRPHDPFDRNWPRRPSPGAPGRMRPRRRRILRPPQGRSGAS
jgi:hypothetical protein